MIATRIGARRLALAGFTLLLLAAAAWAQSAPQILAPGAKWEEVSRVGKVWGEGVVAAKDGSIYVTDMTYKALMPENNPGGTIYRIDPKTKAATKVMEPSGMANGLHIDRRGDLIIAQDADGGGRGVLRRNLKSGKITVLAKTYEGKPLNAANDVTSDSRGRVYFSDARYRGDEPPELPNAVYRIDRDGRLTRLDTGVFRPNGIEVSPGDKYLYVVACNAVNQRLRANPNGPDKDRYDIKMGGAVRFDLDRQGNISNPKVVFRSELNILADGSAIDTDGNLYLALHNGNGHQPNTRIAVVSTDGQVQFIEGPGVGLITNLAFGRGEDANTLYISTGEPFGVFRIKTGRKGLYQ